MLGCASVQGFVLLHSPVSMPRARGVAVNLDPFPVALLNLKINDSTVKSDPHLLSTYKYKLRGYSLVVRCLSSMLEA